MCKVLDVDIAICYNAVMKKFLTTIFIFGILSPAFADINDAKMPELNKATIKKHNNLPQGTFKKQKDGTIVQYDKNGKKIGKYKLDSGRYYRFK